MKHKRNAKALFVVLLFVFFTVLVNIKPANAYQHDTSEEACRANFKQSLMASPGNFGYGLSEDAADFLTVEAFTNNAALRRGCNRCLTETNNPAAKGVAWINDYSADYVPTTQDNASIALSEMFDTTASATTMDSNEEITVYFHGNAYGCGSGGYASNSSDPWQYGYNGIDLHILNGVCKPDRPETVEDENHNEVHNYCSSLAAARDYLGYDEHDRALNSGTGNKTYVRNIQALATSSLKRMLPGNGFLPAYQWSFPGAKVSVQINVRAFKEWVTEHANDDPNDDTYYIGDTYQDTIYVFRCPEGIYLNNQVPTSSRSCGTDKSIIRITISPDIFIQNCSEKYASQSTTYNFPSWYGNSSISYNKCSGTSVLGSRIAINGGTSKVVGSTTTDKSAEIYARPGNTIYLNHFFVSAAQPASATLATENLIPSGIAGSANWNNKYSIAMSDNTGKINASWTDGGDIGVVKDIDLGITYTVEPGRTDDNTYSGSDKTGKIKVGTKLSSSNSGSNSNLGSVTIGSLNAEGVTGVKYDVDSVAVSVVVPYNFVNTTTANTEDSVYYAGSTARVGGTFTTGTVYNDLVKATYATRSPSAQLGVHTYYSNSDETGSTISGNSIVSSFNCASLRGGCTTKTSTETLNGSDNVNGSNKEIAYSINVPDIDAGKWICTVSTVYPAGSGNPGNYTDPEGTHTWYVSPSKCAQIAKKPSFELWNGNLYANGNIQTNTSTKYTVAGHNEIGSSNPRTFGSWVEHGLIVKGNNNKLASGAVLGYQTNSNTNLSNNPGGHSEGITPGVCKRSPLTIANQPCVTGGSTSGDSGIAVTETVNLSDYISVAQTTTSVQTGSNDVDLSSSNYYTEKNGIRYTYNSSSSKLHLKASSNLPSGVTHIIYSKGSVYIHGNLTYTNGPYSSPSNVPQYIIITDGSIFIDGAVTRVDSWLVADGKKESSAGAIKTCADSNGEVPIGEQYCFNQLRINGPIIAKKMELTRLYGAATGNNSATSAEILNFAPSTYIFSQSKASENTSLRTVFSKEVAPRW